MTNSDLPGRAEMPDRIEPEPALAGYPPPAPSTQVAPWGAPAAGSDWSLRLPPVSAPPVRPVPALPDGPREYQQLLRGPRHRWWRPLIALLLAAAIVFPLVLLAFLPVALAGLVIGVSDPLRWAARAALEVDDLGPAGFLYVNLSLIVLIPTAGWSIWIAHRIRPRYLASVRGRIRWRWLLRCVVVVVPVWALYLGLSAVLDPTRSARPAQWGLLLVIVVLLTPLQAAGEEYFFRGWILQNVGSWFRRPLVGLAAGLVVSVVTFSAAHGSRDIWILGSLGVFALTAGLATWLTGGLEAGIVIHAVNNVGVFFTVILVGGWQQAFVSGSSTSTPLVFAVDVVVHAIALTLIVWQAKRVGLERLYRPTVGAAQAPAAAGVPAAGVPEAAPALRG